MSYRNNGDLFKTSTSLRQYYQWLNKQNPASLLEFENRTTNLKSDKSLETLSDVLPNLYDTVEHDKSKVEVLRVKEAKFLNAVIKQLKESKRSTEVVVKKEDAKPIVDKNIEKETKKEKQPVKPAKPKSSTSAMLGALSQRRSARLHAEPDAKNVLEGTYVSKTSGNVRFSSPPSKSDKKKANHIAAQEEKEKPKESLTSREKEEEHEEDNAEKPRFGM